MKDLKLEIKPWCDFLRLGPIEVYKPKENELTDELAAGMRIQAPRDVHNAFYSIDKVYNVGFQLYVCFAMKCDTISKGKKEEMRVFAKITNNQLEAIKEYNRRQKEKAL